MSYIEGNHIRWDSTDFKKHGYIATYAVGGCRCVKCKQGWEAWNPNERKSSYTHLLKEGKPRGKYRRRTTT